MNLTFFTNFRGMLKTEFVDLRHCHADNIGFGPRRARGALGEPPAWEGHKNHLQILSMIVIALRLSIALCSS